jgi:molybdenum cofactor synthesis domain-containing protein
MPNSTTPELATPTFGLIIIGDEILSGKRADKHMTKVIEILANRGLALGYANYVGDDPVRITAALKAAFESGDVVFSTGGIGATPDDHTRQCAAKALGPYEPQREDNQHRLNMAVFPAGCELIPNPYNKIAGFSVSGVTGSGAVYFVPGFPVMAWPMMEWVLDTHYSAYFNQTAHAEWSVIVQGSMEATLTPLMEQIEAQYKGIKVFSLPSVDHPKYGRHIELGVKGSPEQVALAYPAMIAGLKSLGSVLLDELKR